ncbi:unnamed protein product [Prorocentrum cordatum]|uniref:Cyclic nucleotide-binding domain-containing protein n=1 Tax=Prorocentrum cordatum TaxID=2364126 RepID=A0ABN9WLL5_9DINO|nr:unnamed protein product [Polarella glacialis]
MALGPTDDDLYQDVFEPYGVDTEQFRVLMSSGTRIRGTKGTVIVKAGTPCTKVHLLLFGEAVARKGDAEGQPVCRYPGRTGGAEVLPAPGSEGAEESPDSGVPKRGCVIGGSVLVDPMRLETPYPNTVVAESDVEWIQWELHELKRVVARKNWRSEEERLALHRSHQQPGQRAEDPVGGENALQGPRGGCPSEAEAVARALCFRGGAVLRLRLCGQLHHDSLWGRHRRDVRRALRPDDAGGGRARQLGERPRRPWSR